MIKSVLKEICIMLLLCVAILLVLGVIFYDSIPSNKVVPNKLSAYTTSENVQAEIDEEVSTADTVEVSYEITSSDLNLFKQAQSYTSGKVDPFANTASTDDENTEGGTASSGTNTNASTSNNCTTTTDPNSTGTFFNTTGK